MVIDTGLPSSALVNEIVGRQVILLEQELTPLQKDFTFFCIFTAGEGTTSAIPRLGRRLWPRHRAPSLRVRAAVVGRVSAA